ncbi:MAG: hypothetical protein R3Y44_07615, partial [Rikenellaceae bacterium]
GEGQRPEMGNGERPQRGEGERPEMGNGERPQRGEGERPEMGNGERPNMEGRQGAGQQGRQGMPGGNHQAGGASSSGPNWIDVHGAGSQRSDPKSGDASIYASGNGPQGDAIRINNYVRLVRDL